MKIIGEQDGHNMIVIASKNELARCAGLYYASDAAAPKMRVGMTIHVAKLYDRVVEIGRQRAAVDGARKTLIAAADILAPIIPMVDFEDRGNDE